MSFAGQQDTYLNIVGSENLLKAVIDCWSSLWTARAIGYRLRNHVPQSGAALAVVVQRMVESRVAGVLFTANPLTGLRTQTVIDAAFGLGEALVSGKVEPDHYVVDAVRGQIVSKTLGTKAIAIHGQSGGGTAEISGDYKTHQALPDAQILELTRLCQQVAERYGFPQDIEWAWADDRLYLLQSRPITSLFPTPQGMPAEPLKVLFSFGAIQGLLDPVTPLGQDALKVIFATGARLFGIPATSETQTVLVTAGERLWGNFTPVMRNSVGRKAVYEAVGIIEPTIKQALEEIWDDPHLQPERRGIRLRAILQLARVFVPIVANLLVNIASPRARREYIVNQGEQILQKVREGSNAISGDRWSRLALQADLLEQVTRDHLPRVLILFFSGVVGGMASYNFLRMTANGISEKAAGKHEPVKNWSDLVLETTRGLPNNPTTEMDLALWAIARAIQHNPIALDEFQGRTAAELSGRYLSGQMRAEPRGMIEKFLDRYGGRGLAEIDMGRERWQENPTHVMEMLSGYLKIEDGNRAPDVLFARGADEAQRAVDQLAASLGQTRGGWFKAHRLRFIARRMRELMSIRESPKFFAVRLMAQIRDELLKSGAAFVEAGDLEQADDLFYLSFAEIRRFAKKDPRDWRSLIAARREGYRREKLRRQIPRLLLSDGRAFYEGMRAAGEGGKGLTGSPVSPGSAEGQVRVVLDPRQANLQPGEILVCPGTDPSWTPLFLSAAGLVMEVGGMMTHGAVVAREYGIPAIVGVDRATQRLQTGQRIRINGSTGQIELLEE